MTIVKIEKSWDIEYYEEFAEAFDAEDELRDCWEIDPGLSMEHWEDENDDIYDDFLEVAMEILSSRKKHYVFNTGVDFNGFQIIEVKFKVTSWREQMS